jgi:hypothetical protein
VRTSKKEIIMPTTLHEYNIQTGEYLYPRPAQIVGGKEMTICSSATTVAPPADIPAGKAARWTGSAWQTVEDHRQKMDDKGNKIGGTAYWLPGDSHHSQGRYMETLGPLPPGALLEAPALTATEIAAARRGEILGRLSAIDQESVRPLRAITDDTGTDFDRQRLSALDAEAATLRAELATLPAN